MRSFPAFTTRLWAPALTAALLLSSCASLELPSTTLAVASTGKAANPVIAELGDELSWNAERKALAAEQEALETGRTGVPVEWVHSDEVRGRVVPSQPYSVGTSSCRRYTHTVFVSGDAKAVTATACRDESGDWKPLT